MYNNGIVSVWLLQEELEREGIWDFNRLSLPYIRHDMLQVAEIIIIIVYRVHYLKLGAAPALH